MYNEGRERIIESMDVVQMIRQLSDLKILLGLTKVSNPGFMQMINYDRTNVIVLDEEQDNENNPTHKLTSSSREPSFVKSPLSSLEIPRGAVPPDNSES